jgi:hypothetical protein
MASFEKKIILSFYATFLERALDTIKDGAHDAGTQLYRQRLSRPEHGITHRHTASFLVHLRMR